MLEKTGWRLSPAYDINPVTPANGLHLNITEDNNQLDLELAMEVIDYFRIKPTRATEIKQKVCKAVSQWSNEAKLIGINRVERERMEQAFRH